MLSKKSINLICTIVVAALLPTTGLCLWTTQDSTQNGAGMSAQTSIANGGTNGWTFARYSLSGVSIDWRTIIHGIKFSGGETFDSNFDTSSYALAEYYWDGTIYGCAISEVLDLDDFEHRAFAEIHGQ